jgi:hypothetical protein
MDIAYQLEEKPQQPGEGEDPARDEAAQPSVPYAAAAPALASADEPQQRAAPRGKPWVKGQSGNPVGRPSRAYKAASVAHALFDRKTPELVDRAIAWCQGRDRGMLRAYLQRLVPPRREAPVYLGLPPLETRDDLTAALTKVANAVVQGDIPTMQGERLVRMLLAIRRTL